VQPEVAVVVVVGKEWVVDGGRERGREEGINGLSGRRMREREREGWGRS